MAPKRKAVSRSNAQVEEAAADEPITPPPTPVLAREASAEAEPTPIPSTAVEHSETSTRQTSPRLQAQTVSAALPATLTGSPGAAVPSAPQGDAARQKLTEIFTSLQSLVGSTETLAQINEHVAELLALVQAAENPTTPLLLRVRFLEFVARVVPAVRDSSALKKIVTSLVKIIAGEDDNAQLLIAAINCFAGLGPVSMLDKRSEYLSREGADVLMQIILDQDAFVEAVRQAASKAMDTLTTTAFKPVVTKLLHWISDEREEDTEEQLIKERRAAMNRLTRLTRAPSMRSHWTNELQEYVIGLIARVLGTANLREFRQLLRMVASLPINHEKGYTPLVDCVLQGVMGGTGGSSGILEKSEQAMEALSELNALVPAGTESTALFAALESAGVTQQNIEEEGNRGVYSARLLLLATRVASAERESALCEHVFTQLHRLSLHSLGDSAINHTTTTTIAANDDSNHNSSKANGESDASSMLHGNLSTLEAVLMSAVAVARRQSAEVLRRLSEEAFASTMSALSSRAERAEKLAIFACKKMMQQKQQGAGSPRQDNSNTSNRVDSASAQSNQEAGHAGHMIDYELLHSLHNIAAISSAFSARHLPTAELKESWNSAMVMPVSLKDAVAEGARDNHAPGGMAKRPRSSSASSTNAIGNRRPPMRAQAPYNRR